MDGREQQAEEAVIKVPTHGGKPPSEPTDPLAQRDPELNPELTDKGKDEQMVRGLIVQWRARIRE